LGIYSDSPMKRMTLKQARVARGWTQQQLEQASGVAQSAISKIERNEINDPQVSTAAALEKALALRHGTLIFGQPSAVAS